VITILNNSNVPISNLRVIVNIDNDVRVDNVISATIPVSALYSYEIPFSIIESGIKFVCVELVIENDANPLSNRYCSTIDSRMVSLTPYPNPANNELFIEWIAGAESSAGIRLISSLGKEIAEWNVEGVAGLNQMRINTSGLPGGLYILTIDAKDSARAFRVVIEH
jgi:hypothetical protein